MQTETFTLETEYIELIALLKFMGLAQTGGHAKMLVDDNMVVVNGIVENRKRYKVRKGDVVVVDEQATIVVE